MKAVVRDRKAAVLTKSSLSCLSQTATVNLTSGCAHGCLYCYTRCYRGHPGEGRVVVYGNTLEKLRDELPRKRKRPKAVYFSPSSDLFQPVPEVLELGYDVLSYLLNEGIGVAFLTKGVIPERHMKLLQENASLVRAQIGVTTLDEEVAALFEPHAACPEIRLAQFRRLIAAGIKAQARLDPIIPGITDSQEGIEQLMARLADCGTSQIAASALFVRPKIVPFLKRGLRERPDVLSTLLARFEPGAKMKLRGAASEITALSGNERQNMYERLREAAHDQGIAVRVCACKNWDISSESCEIAGRWDGGGEPVNVRRAMAAEAQAKHHGGFRQPLPFPSFEEWSDRGEPKELERDERIAKALGQVTRDAIITNPGQTQGDKPFDWYVQEKIDSGEYREESVDHDTLGLSHPLEILRARRKSDLIKPWPDRHDESACCPAHWADLAIGRGACGLRCRMCFLMLTHRIFADPSRHIVYENVDDYERAVRRWLLKPDRKCLGLGLDCSDSLLYEGVTGHARRLVPLFSSATTNPHGIKLVLLTKSTNARFLKGLPTGNVIVTFSLNPEPIADLWEGKFSDGARVTPVVSNRLEAGLEAQRMGFETRWRIDPILPIRGWRHIYRRFIESAVKSGHRPSRITMGTYRETQPSLDKFREGWGLPAPEWNRPDLSRKGAFYRGSALERIGIYSFVRNVIKDAWKEVGHEPVIALCKEDRRVRRLAHMDHDKCNCGP